MKKLFTLEFFIVGELGPKQVYGCVLALEQDGAKLQLRQFQVSWDNSITAEKENKKEESAGPGAQK